MAQSIKLLSDESVGRILEGARDTFTHIAEQTRATSIINWQKEAGFARQLVLRDERLLQADPESIKNAITNVAATGLTLNPVKQHAVILSRWNEKRRSYEAQLVVMYRGLLWLAGQAGVKDISIDVVYSADHYEAIRSSEGDRWTHKPARLAHDNIANKFELVYVGARMPDSTVMKLEQIPAEDIYRARDKSDSYLDKEGKVRKSSPWVQWFDEMAKKTGLKRAQKRWEEAIIERTETNEWRRFQTAVALDNVAEGVVPARSADVTGSAENLQLGNDKQKSDEKLSMAQLTAIEKLVEQVAPNSDKFPNNVSAYMTRIARLYRCSTLNEVSATKYKEIEDRINDAIQKVKAKAAADKTGAAGKGEAAGTKGSNQSKGTEGQGHGGKQQDASAKGTGQQVGGQAAGGAAAGQQQHAGSGGSGDGKPAGNRPGADAGGADAGEGAGREPGSDDDAGDEGHGRHSEDPGPSYP